MAGGEGGGEQSLEGVTVLALEQSVSGPLCTRLLADLGARVIKVERPGVGDLSRSWDQALGPWSSVDLWVNANKESLTLDMKQERGREILLRLVERADVVLETFTPGAAARMGLDYETLRARNPSVVYCHISGYGQSGPYRDRKAMDLLIQGEAGLIELTGSESEPARLAVSVADISSGLYAAVSILAALHHARATGRGQEIDVSMLDTTVSLLGYWTWRFWYKGVEPRRLGMRHPLIVPYGVFRARDGYVNICVSTESMWRRFCEVLDLPAFLEDPRFASNEARVENRASLEAALDGILAGEDRRVWIERLDGASVPCASVNRLEEVLEHPQIRHRELIRTLDSAYGEVRILDFPAKLSATPSQVRTLPPELGRDTEAGLAGLGYDESEIQALARANVV